MPHPRAAPPAADGAPAETVSLSTPISDVCPSPRADAAQRVGDVLLGRYELVRVLGSGGAGDVYEARDRQLGGQPLALKVLRNPSANGLYRLKQEFRTLSGLSHAHLVALHDLHCEGELAFFTMELVRGDDFFGYVRPRGELDQARLADALRGLVQGVAALHQAGWIHRDLKPSNVLVSDAGRVVLLDFGLAQLLDPAARVATEVGFTGTVAYAAPEQFAGNATQASDWYAVGTMLHEVLTSALPFEGGLDEVARAKVDQREPAALAVPEGLAPLAELSRRLLAADPARRPGGAQVLARLGAPPPVQVRGRSENEPLVGRAAELATLEAAFARVERGERAVVTLEGCSGIGKTKLAQRFLATLRAERRACVLSARCYVREEVPYRAVDGIIDELSHTLRGLSPLTAATLLPRNVRALAQVFPVLLRVPAIAAIPPGRTDPRDDGRAQRARAAAALKELLLALSDRMPVVLFVDDEHWCDADSAWLLGELLSGDPPASLLLLLTRRSEAPPSPLEPILRADAALSAVVERMALAPLEAGAIAQIARRELGDGAATDELRAIAEESAGHPLFALELARHVARCREPVQVSLDAAIAARVAALSPGAAALFATLCVAGRPLPSMAAADMAGVTGSALQELLHSKLVRANGPLAVSRIEPYHDRIREAGLALLTESEQHARHGALAEACEREGGGAAELAVDHYLAAGRPHDAARMAEPAAEHARACLAFHRVPPLLELALRHAAAHRRPALQRALADAYACVGRVLDAAQALLAAARLETDEDARFSLECRAMWHALRGGHDELGMPLYHALARSLGSWPLVHPWLGWLVTTPLYVLWLVTGVPPLAPRPPGDDVRTRRARRLLTFSWLATSSMVGRDTLRTGYAGVLALRLAARLSDASIYAPMRAVIEAGKGVFRGREPASYERALAECSALALGAGDRGAGLGVELARLSGSMGTGAFARAEGHAARIVDEPTEGSEHAGYVQSLARLTAIALFFWRGRMRHGGERAKVWRRSAAAQHHEHMSTALDALSAYHHLADDRADDAISAWSAAATRDPDNVAFWDALWGVVPGLYAGRLDQCERALAVARRALFRWTLYVATSRVLWVWCRGALAAAHRARGARGYGVRLALFAGSVWLRAEGTPLAHPLALHLRAVRALHRGDRAASVRLLAEAHAAFGALGLPMFAACCAFVLSELSRPDGTHGPWRERARAYFEHERVVCPERMARALVPGFSALSQR